MYLLVIFLSLCPLLLCGDLHPEIPVEVDPVAKPYVTKEHIAHIRHSLEQMVGSDELPFVRVEIGLAHMGAIQASARLPDQRGGSLRLHRRIVFSASDWPGAFGKRQVGPRRWKTARDFWVTRVFELSSGPVIDLSVSDKMSYDETRRVLEAIASGAFTYSAKVEIGRRPKLREVCWISKDRRGRLEICTLTDRRNDAGDCFVSTLENGRIVIHEVSHWVV